jgi:hypothetical protein
VRDAIEFEWAGRPSVALIATQFIPGTEMMKRVSRMPDYPYVVTVNGIGGMTRAELDAQAKLIAPAVMRCLMERDVARTAPRAEEECDE